MAPRLTAALAAATMCLLLLASASSLAVSAGSLGAGWAAVSACQGGGFVLAYTINTSGQITTVNVSGIAAACAGGTLRLTLTNGTTSVGAGTVSPLGASGSASVAL